MVTIDRTNARGERSAGPPRAALNKLICNMARHFVSVAIV